MPEVSLNEITFDTVRDVAALEVAPNQRRYVASNALSIAEAHFNPGAWLRKIEADGQLAGFLMLLDPNVPGALTRSPVASDEIYLWRFMIDHRFQRLGIGKRALDLVCQHLRVTGQFRQILSSYVVGLCGPELFYMNYGFCSTGRLRNKESEIEIAYNLMGQ